MSSFDNIYFKIGEQVGGIFSAFLIIMAITWAVSKIRKLFFNKHTNTILTAEITGGIFFVGYYILVYQGKVEFLFNAISFAGGTVLYIGYARWRHRLKGHDKTDG